MVGEKFLVDVMLQKLGRWLRILGVQTDMPGDEDDTKILEQAKRDGRILLTRDQELVERANRLKIKVFAIPKEELGVEGQLRLVVKKFKIKIEGFEERTLCTKCGGKLELVGKKEVEGKVPEDVVDKFDDFLRCKSCGQVYWEGSHWRKINERIRRMQGKESG
jgi:hypothetical protein